MWITTAYCGKVIEKFLVEGLSPEYITSQKKSFRNAFR